ncbi:MAG: hypothetical protein HKN82_10635 [Akkermansiaceae bacterium]|nr:hypothetical protein [Akkermansiaceae bacterium]
MTPEDGERQKSSAGLVFVTITALLMAMGVAILPVWLGGAGKAVETDVWQTFYGDLHPLLLPIPIGVFVLILLMEVCGLLSFGKWKPHTTFPLFVGVVTAVLAVIAGNFLHLRTNGSDGATYHHIWGFTVFSVLAILTFVSKIWSNHSGAKSPMYGILLLMTVGALVFTGAQGGVLQWKEPFQAPMAGLFGGEEPQTVKAEPAAPGAEGGATQSATQPLAAGKGTTPGEDPAKPDKPEVVQKQAAPPEKAAPDPAKKDAPKPAPPAPKPPEVPAAGGDKAAGKPGTAVQAKAIPDRLAYEDVVKPILRARCYECHADAKDNPLGKKKIKGSLVLTSIEAMKEGGSEAEALVPGDLEASLMSVRIHLPMDDDEHMPPEDKDQLEAHEIAILDWWIKTGAPTVSMKEAMAGPEILAAVGKLVPPDVLEKKRAAAAAAQAAEKAAAAEKRKMLESAMAQASREFPNALTFISRESSDLQFTAVSMRKDFTDAKLAILKPVGSGLVEVNLGATSVSDAGLGELAAMPNLRKLHLQQTKITDAGLAEVAKLKNLEWLNLFGTEVTDEGVRKLKALPKLKKVYLWGTKVTPEGAKALEKNLPGCEVNLGAGN